LRNYVDYLYIIPKYFFFFFSSGGGGGGGGGGEKTAGVHKSKTRKRKQYIHVILHTFIILHLLVVKRIQNATTTLYCSRVDDAKTVTYRPTWNFLYTPFSYIIHVHTVTRRPCRPRVRYIRSRLAYRFDNISRRDFWPRHVIDRCRPIVVGRSSSASSAAGALGDYASGRMWGEDFFYFDKLFTC